VVVVAARDEAARIGATLAALAAALPGAQLWLADDGSRDATARIAERMGARVVTCAGRLGKGAAMTAAVRRALRCARASGGAAGETIFILCDGDLGCSAGLLSELAYTVARDRGDLAVAAFERAQGGGLGLVRAFARHAVRSRCGLSLRAPLSGQRALRAGALERLLPFAEGFGMELGMTLDASRAGLAIVEIGLDLEHRSTGRSPAGFAHRARQLREIVRAYRQRR